MARDDEPDDTDTPAPTRRPRDGSGTPRTRRTFDRYAADDDRPKRKAGFPVWGWVLIGVGTLAVLGCGGGLAALILSGGFKPGALRNVDTTAPAKRTYTRDEFRALVVGKTEAEVKEAAGPPDRTQDSERTHYWYYERITIDPANNKPDTRAQLVIVDGIVTRVSY